MRRDPPLPGRKSRHSSRESQGGFSPVQLYLNYLAFVPLPAIVLGLYAGARPSISRLGLWGALLYGFAFVYFTSTTLFAIAQRSPDYEALWPQLGGLYTAHGVLMIVGGACFGAATLSAGVLPRWTGWLFLTGIAVNLVLGLLPAPDLLQTLGSALRNTGLIGMGWAALQRERPLAAAT